jgi:hypothetical protein
MVIYPVPIEVTQARVQLVADQTAKAPAHIIHDDVLEVAAAKNQADRQASSTSRFKRPPSCSSRKEPDRSGLQTLISRSPEPDKADIVIPTFGNARKNGLISQIIT